MLNTLKNVLKRNNPAYNFFYNIKNQKCLNTTEQTYHQLIQLETANPKEISSLQQTKLLDIITHAYNTTEYYKNLFDQHNIDITDINSLKSIPLLTKEIIKSNTQRMISSTYHQSDLQKRNTGGSTGAPLEFFVDRICGCYDNAHHWYLYNLMGYQTGDIIISGVGITLSETIRAKNIFWERTSRHNVFGEYSFSALYINEKNIQLYVQKLLEIKPAILRGYPSFFDLLAKYIIRHNIRIDFKIKGINLTAEMCSIEQQKNIESAFSSMIYYEYGHTEMALYCYTNTNEYIYKSSPIYGYIEVLNEDHTDTKIGEIGKIVVTGFNNRGMPFIRYDTGDLGELVYRNEGEVHFKKIHGRSQDYLLDKFNNKILLTALIFGQHMKAFKNIVKWQLVQNEIGKVTINIIKDSNYSLEDEKDLLENFNRSTVFDISFNYVHNIPLTKRGKHLFLVQNIIK